MDRYHPLMLCAVANEPFELVGTDVDAYRLMYLMIGIDATLEQPGAKACIRCYGVPEYDPSALSIELLQAASRNESLRPVTTPLRECMARHDYVCSDALHRLANACVSLTPEHDGIAYWHCVHAVGPLITARLVHDAKGVRA